MSRLGEWVPRLSSVELPVLRATAEGLARLRANEDQVTAREVAALVLRDPLMTVKVLRYSQSRLTQRQATEVTTVEHAVMMHGVGRFFAQFDRLDVLEDTLAGNPDALRGALAVISRAQHAAVNARNFSAVRHDMEGEEVVVSALLHDLAELLLWWAAADVALQIEHMLACNRGLRSAAAQRAVLGFPLADLQLALARDWQLPRLLTALMDDAHAQNHRVQTVHLSVAIARHTAHGWHDPALPDDYKQLRALLNVPADGARRWAKQSAVQAARHWQTTGVRPAAGWLPMLPGEWPPGREASGATASALGAQFIDRVTAQLEQSVPGIDQAALVALAFYGLERGAGLRRMSVLCANAKTRRMEPRQSLFFDEDLLPEELGFEIGSGHLFDRLLAQGQAVWHAPPRTGKLASLLPATLRPHLAQAPFFAIGLRPEKRLPTLLFADAGSSGAVDEAGYNAFKRIALALSKALERAGG
jgi:HD-like signal output (HDOD) protein